MKKFLIALAVLLLTGCAGWSFNLDVAGSYRSDVPLGTRGK
jgi:hypothetical protein